MTFGIRNRLPFSEDNILNTTRVFASLSLIYLISTPLIYIFQAIPTVIASVACFSRIQSFLASAQKREYRVLEAAPSSSTHSNSGSSATETIEKSTDLLGELDTIAVHNVSFGWSADKEAVVEGLNFRVRKASLSMIIGPVGSGKSTILKGLLGEVPVVHGLVAISNRDMSYCSQEPWLSNDTIKNNIVAFERFEPVWYREVLDACALTLEVGSMRDRDDTMVGSKGAALSGGQRMRVVSILLNELCSSELR